MAAMNIEVELDDYTLKKAVAVCEREGISLEGAVAVFVNQIAVEGSIPLNGGMLALRKLGEEAKRNGTANMTLEEMSAQLIPLICELCEDGIPCTEAVQGWLESMPEEEQDEPTFVSRTET